MITTDLEDAADVAARMVGRDHSTSACSTDDLKCLMQELAHQLAETDRRHFNALQDMQERLATLGRDAEDVRPSVPEEFVPAFQRIEDGMLLLLERIADTGRQRRTAEAGPREPVPGPWQPEPAVAVDPAPETARDFASVPSSFDAPRFGHGATPQSEETPGEISAGAFPAPQPAAWRDPVSGWDQHAADALVRIYEPEPDGASEAPTEGAAASTPQPMAEQRDGTTTEREWLEARFAEIAARVAHSLAEMNPENSFIALDQRMSQFEQRFGLALEQVATRADVEGLRIVEAHINELTQHIGHTQHQLARLDVIEAQLGELMQRMSETGPADSRPAPPWDIESVARLVAERVSSRIPQPAATSDPAHFEELRAFIQNVVGGHRQGEEQTAGVLDTMQEAMIRLLDRMDALEGGRSLALHQPPFPEPPRPSSATSAHGPAPDSAPGFQEPMLSLGAAGRDQLGVVNLQAAPDEFVYGDLPRPMPAPAEQPQPHDEAQPPVGEPQLPTSREDFIAAARRAARQASTRMNEEKAAAEQARAARGKGARTRARNEAATVNVRLRQALMVATIAVLGIGAGYTMLGKYRASQNATAERAMTPETDEGGDQNSPSKTQSVTPRGGAGRQGSLPGGGADAPETPEAKGQRVGKTTTSPEASSEDVHGTDQPKPQQRLRPVPETLVDELRDRRPVPESPAPQIQADSSTATAAVAPHGIMVHQTGSLPTPGQLMRAHEHQRMATLSSQLGAAQPAAAATHAALTPDARQAPQPQAALTRTSPTDLPPAMVGPLSLRLAAAKGDPSAEFEVAARLAEGRGIAQDFKQAIHWYQRSAAQGFAPAQYRLGTFYERGLGTKADLARAKTWYKRAAEQGNVKAMHNLAVLSAGRDPSAADYPTAARWFGEAAARGLADSQYNLGILHEMGMGVPKDLKQAYKWLALAARSGDDGAARRRDMVKAKLDAAELAAAEDLFQAWRATPADGLNDARAAGEAWKGRQAGERPN